MCSIDHKQPSTKHSFKHKKEYIAARSKLSQLIGTQFEQNAESLFIQIDEKLTHANK